MRPEISVQNRQADFFQVCGSCRIGCCNGVRPPITTKRKAIIENYLNAEGVKIEAHFNEIVYTFPRETEDGYCIFFQKETRRCRIHPVKPETCVAGPVTFDINLETGKIEWFLKMEAICPLAGELYEDKKALLSHMESAKYEILNLVHDLNAAELHEILKIEEPETFKIGEDNTDPEVITKLKPSV